MALFGIKVPASIARVSELDIQCFGQESRAIIAKMQLQIDLCFASKFNVRSVVWFSQGPRLSTKCFAIVLENLPYGSLVQPFCDLIQDNTRKIYKHSIFAIPRFTSIL